jgi:hypothetical protein
LQFYRSNGYRALRAVGFKGYGPDLIGRRGMQDLIQTTHQPIYGPDFKWLNSNLTRSIWHQWLGSILPKAISVIPDHYLTIIILRSLSFPPIAPPTSSLRAAAQIRPRRSSDSRRRHYWHQQNRRDRGPNTKPRGAERS